MISNRIYRNTIVGGSVTIAIVTAFVIANSRRSKTGDADFMRVRTERRAISHSITMTGIVEPQNRLELKPAINGRVDEILVREGDRVEAGQILAWLSSTERAALLDAALAQGEESVRYWKGVYNATPIISPIAGEVIVRGVEPGQTVTNNDPVLVLSDRLIVTAQVDETDIGGVEVGQEAVITLDAYPGTSVRATVDHVAYESQLINNVTIYEVDIVPSVIPPVFRSGMSANVEIVKKRRENVLVLPAEAVKREERGDVVLVEEMPGEPPFERVVETGISDGSMTEIVSGLKESDIIIIPGGTYIPPGRMKGRSNPFMPFGRRKGR